MRFVDTSFWVALQFTRDAHHDAARRLWVANSEPLLTTNHVVGETWTFLRRRLGHTEALAFVERVPASSKVAQRRLDEATERDAWDWLKHHDERAYSFVDATSFVFMRRHNIVEAFAFDDDFAAAGFTEVRPRD